MIGLDLEWKALMVTGAPPCKTATIQLSTSDRVLVLQLSAMSGRQLPPALRALLEDAAVVKAGVGILNDGIKLRRDFGVRCNGLLDLSKLAGAVLPDGARCWSLAGLCERVLQRRMPKASSLRLSDWEATRLSPEQIEYAAIDAFVSHRVGLQLERLPWRGQPHTSPAADCIPASQAGGSTSRAGAPSAVVAGAGAAVDVETVGFRGATDAAGAVAGVAGSAVGVTSRILPWAGPRTNAHTQPRTLRDMLIHVPVDPMESRPAPPLLQEHGA